MNNTNAYIIAVLLLVFGGILLLYRLLYMFCQGQPWNNPPTTLSWSFVLSLTGLAVIGLILSTPGCDNKCARHDNLVSLAWGWGVILSLTYPLMWACRDKLRRKGLVKQQGQGQEQAPDQASSGFDFLLLMIGAGLILADLSLGTCPESC